MLLEKKNFKYEHFLLKFFFCYRDQLFVLQHILYAIEKCKDNISISNWILELLGQTQVYMVDANQFNNQVSFMCDVLMISILTISGHNVFLPTEKDINMELMMFLFPHALAMQLKNDNWNQNVPQVCCTGTCSTGTAKFTSL